MPHLEDMTAKRNERKNQFSEVLKQINSISMELAGSTETSLVEISVDESDLSIKKLDDLRTQLLLLQKEKVLFSFFTFSYVEVRANCLLNNRVVK